MTIPSPSTKEAVEFASIPVSSLVVILGIGVSRSPFTSSFILSAQAFIGLLICVASTSATMTDATIDSTITARLITMASRVDAR